MTNSSNTSAFMRGEPTSAASRRSTADASASFSCTGSGRDLHLLLHLFGLEMGDQRVDHGLNAAVHELLQLVRGEADAMVGHAVLGEVVGSDLLAAIATAHHRLALLGQRVLLLLLLHFVQAGAQHAHSFLAILDLRLLVLAAHHRVGWQVRNADRRVRRIHRLTAGTGGAEGEYDVLGGPHYAP